MILITGATGCLGANLVEQLAPDFPIRVLVRDEAKLRSMVGDAKCEIVRGDLTDQAVVKRAVTGISTVLHCAVINHGASGFTPAKARFANRVGMENLIRGLERGQGAQLVFMSSQSAYGVPLHSPMCEEHPLNGRGPYSEDKVFNEGLAMEAHRRFGLPVTILRLTGFHGRHLSQPSMISQLLPAVHGKAVFVPAAAVQWDFTHVDDVVRAIRAAIGNEKVYGEAVNVPGSGPIPANDYFRKWAEIAGAGARVVQVPRWTARLAALFSANVREHLYFLYNDILMTGEKARRLLGYQASCSYDEGIAKTVGWLQQKYGRAKTGQI